MGTQDIAQHHYLAARAETHRLTKTVIIQRTDKNLKQLETTRSPAQQPLHNLMNFLASQKLFQLIVWP